MVVAKLGSSDIQPWPMKWPPSSSSCFYALGLFPGVLKGVSHGSPYSHHTPSGGVKGHLKSPKEMAHNLTARFICFNMLAGCGTKAYIERIL